MKMECGCYFNNKGFTVGTKWLTIENRVCGFKRKVRLTPALLRGLEEIKRTTLPQDANRTWRVIQLVDEHEGYTL
jgi:hypothetical protein